ncbi:HNH endonuclease signature motif containing protein [Blastococcus sp. PRF04-17]|uniref:HNH endonuclease signature motif containing protein n=1 Tax=Blastococcus sp. PRF04-17 TaxID=2933797 RepID=UPI001FF4AA99|nr:HNH endonuclease signature motif containing protein [Blastococcus sp. PRF04-17]UOY01896.1 HNH endonuclease [Blastococcus sp. PRF04-17]
MSELRSALDALAVEDVHALSAREQLDGIRQLLELRNRIDAQLTRRVRAAELQQAPEDDGMKSMRSWLRGHGRLGGAAAGQLVRNGRALDHLPALASAFAEGAVTAEQVAVVAPVATESRRTAALAQGIDLAEIDRTLAEVAAERRIEQLTRVVHHYLSRLDPDGPEPDPTDERSLTLSTFSDGTVVVRGQLDAVGGEKLKTALEAVVQADRPRGDMRSRAQQLADAMVQLADNQLASGDLPVLRTAKPNVVVTIPADDLFDPATGPSAATTAFGSLLSAAKARMLACDGSITPITIDEHGMPLNLGRTKRVVPPHLRKAVELRDETCVFAGCGAPKYWCDVHHLVHWIFGGETSLENSALLCERHHTKVHHGFRVQRDPGGRWRTFRPDGSEIVIAPRLPV